MSKQSGNFEIMKLASPAMRLLGASLLAASIIAVAGPDPVQAQDSANLARQVERLRREMADLQRFVYKGGQPPAPITAPQGGGGALPSDVAARMQVQITQMQEQMRDMNGRVEEVEHRIGLLEDRLNRMSEDLELRLIAIEDSIAKGAGAAPSVPSAMSEGDTPPADGAGEQVAAAPATLPSLPEGSAREQYDFAYNLLKNHQWSEGRAALQAFLEQNPEDELADNAAYWLGETYYINKQYKEAAKAFLDGYRQYPKADKAPDNLLKLGKSLAALDQPEKACTTYAKLLEDYPNSLPRIIKLAKSEQQKLNCP